MFYNVNMINNFLPILAANPPLTLRIEELNLPGKPVLRMNNADQAKNLLVQSSVSSAAVDHVVGVVHQWNLNVQKALPRNLVFEVGYTGSKSDHFDNVWERNPFIPGTTVRPISSLSSIEVQDNGASGNYHGLLTKIERQFASGLTFLQTYTWSKTMFSSFACCGALRPSNPYDGRKGERGLAETDQRHRATSAFLYELPWFRGRRHALAQVLGNWQANGVLVLETGMPFHPLQNTSPVEDGCPRCNRRPDRIAGGRFSADQRTLDRWFDTAAFARALGHFGTAGRNILSAPGLKNLDFSLFKNIPITEAKRIQFRWEMYNSTNTPPFNPPENTIESGDFGRIRSAGLGREMQFGLRLEF